MNASLSKATLPAIYPGGPTPYLGHDRNSPLLTLGDASKVLGLTVGAVNKWLKDGITCNVTAQDWLDPTLVNLLHGVSEGHCRVRLPFRVYTPMMCHLPVRVISMRQVLNLSSIAEPVSKTGLAKKAEICRTTENFLQLVEQAEFTGRFSVAADREEARLSLEESPGKDYVLVTANGSVDERVGVPMWINHLGNAVEIQA